MPRVARTPRAARGRVRERQLCQHVQNQAHFQASPAAGPDLFRHRTGRILRGGRCDRRAGGEEDHGGRILANFFGNDTARGVEARVPVLPLRVVRRGRRRRLPLPGRRPLDRLPRGALRDHDEFCRRDDPHLSDRDALDPRHYALEATGQAPPEATGARQRVGVGGPRAFDSACRPRATERPHRVVRHDLPAKVLRVRVLQHPEAARVHVRGYGVRVAGPDHGTGRVRVSDDARDRTREPPPHLPGAVGLYVRHASRGGSECDHNRTLTTKSPKSHQIFSNITTSQPNIITSHQISSHLTKSHHVSPNLITSHQISSHLTTSHHISPNLPIPPHPPRS